MKFSINNRMIGEGCPPYVVAEISANHNGSLERALLTIEAAKRCGADAVKLQTYTADSITIDCNAPEFMVRGGLWDGYKLYDLYKWAETPYDWHQAMFDHAQRIGLTLFSTPFDETGVDLLESLNSPAYKIASFELVDLPLIKRVSNTGKPIIMSTGMASELEIEEAVVTAREAGCNELVLLHCISSYPAPIEQANLRKMPVLAKRFNTLAGLSDHTMGSTASIVAASMGACLIEKHFTLSRADKGPDSEFSMEPDELRELCIDAKNAWLSLGSEKFISQPCEDGNKKLRRSLYVVKDMVAGEMLTTDNLRRIRPGAGMPPKYYDEVLGKKVRGALKAGTALQFEHIDGLKI